MKRVWILLMALLLALSIVPAALSAGEETETALDTKLEGMRIVALRTYGDTTEVMRVTCVDLDGDEVWSHTLRAPSGQGTCTEAFMGGTSDEPSLILYACNAGIAACDPYTGELTWKITKSDLDLGESISHAVAKDGTLVVGGGFGPDPVAIDVDGNILWRSSSGSEDIFWLDRIVLGEAGIAAHYDHLADDVSGWVLYGYDGKMLDQKAD